MGTWPQRRATLSSGLRVFGVARWPLICQPQQIIRRNLQHLSQGHQGRHGRPFFAMFKIPDGHIADSNDVPQGLFRPTVVFADYLKASAKNFFLAVVFHLAPNPQLEYNHIKLTHG